MTSYPVPGNHDCWWLVLVRSWNRLHAIPGAALDRDDEDAVEALCGAPWPVLTSVCGYEGEWTMPGVFSRLGLRRCGNCCKRLGIAGGKGCPANSAPREGAAA